MFVSTSLFGFSAKYDMSHISAFKNMSMLIKTIYIY